MPRPPEHLSVAFPPADLAAGGEPPIILLSMGEGAYDPEVLPQAREAAREMGYTVRLYTLVEEANG